VGSDGAGSGERNHADENGDAQTDHRETDVLVGPPGTRAQLCHASIVTPKLVDIRL
jgi:hypothetical protein